MARNRRRSPVAANPDHRGSPGVQAHRRCRSPQDARRSPSIPPAQAQPRSPGPRLQRMLNYEDDPELMTRRELNRRNSILMYHALIRFIKNEDD